MTHTIRLYLLEEVAKTSQRAVAKRLGINHGTLSRMLSKPRYVPTQETLRAIEKDMQEENYECTIT